MNENPTSWMKYIIIIVLVMLNPIQIRIQCCVFVIKPLVLREIVKMVLKCLKIPTKSTRMEMLLVHLSRRQLKISSH